MTPEGRIKAQVNKALASLPTYYRFMPVQNGMGMPALDYYCCVNGNFVAIETKVPGKKLTERQRQTALAIKAAHGVVFVIREPADVANMMMELRRTALMQATIYDKLWDDGRPSVD